MHVNLPTPDPGNPGMASGREPDLRRDQYSKDLLEEDKRREKPHVILPSGLMDEKSDH